jgi:hypothetical protein
MIEMELLVLRVVSHKLDERLQMHMVSLLQQLESSLDIAISTLDEIIENDHAMVKPKRGTLLLLLRRSGNVGKIKLISRKTSFQSSIDEIEKWQSMFLQSFYLLALVRDAEVDQQLTEDRTNQSKPVSLLKSLRDAIYSSRTEKSSESIFLDYTKLPTTLSPLQDGAGCLATLTDTGDLVFIDTIVIGIDDWSLKVRYIRDLARILSIVSPSNFGILTCYGVIKISNPSGSVERLHLLFRIPASSEPPISLRTLLRGGRPISIDEKFHLAKRLARAVAFVHIADFVHKNI